MSSLKTDTSERKARAARDDPESRRLGHAQRALLGLLSLPTLGLAFSITMVSTYLGEVTRQFTHQAIVIGVIVGSEGLMALWVPLVVGPWSDKVRTRIGARLPFLIAGAFPAAAMLILIGFIHSLAGVAVVAALFFLAYFVAYEPYRALYPDLVEESAAGRAQSTQAAGRGLGTGLALLGGGLLLSIGRPLPFIVAAGVLVAAVGAFVLLLLRRGLPKRRRPDRGGVRQTARHMVTLLRERPALRAYLIANSLWEMTLAALKAFVVLYLTYGLGYKLSTSSLIIGAVAVLILVGAAGAGKLGDRYGPARVITIALVVYGLCFLVPALTRSRPAIGAAVPFIALGGGALMALAYAVLIPLMPEGEHGTLTGFYGLSRGLGIVTGPILAGVLITATQHGLFASTNGFAAMWLVCAGGALASVPFVRAITARRSRKGKEPASR